VQPEVVNGVDAVNTAVWRYPRLSRALFVAALGLLMAWGVGTLIGAKDPETMRASVMLSVLVLVTLLLFWLVSRADPRSSSLLIILWLSFGLKLLAMAFRFYGGLLADAYAYNAAGRRIAEQLVRGEWPEGIRYFGTEFVRLVTGLVYYSTGVTFYGISILWTWLGLLGMLFFYLAFRTAFPDGNRRLYMALVFLYPSMLLWTSSLGKDALMIFCLGMAVYGAVRVQRRLSAAGLLWLALGTVGMLMIRPHLAAVFAVAFGASAIIRPVRAGYLSPVVRIVALSTVAALCIFVVRTASGYVGLEGLGPEEIFGFIEERQERSERGGAAFEQTDPRTPVGFALAIPTVLFGPFPWEAHNTNAQIASMEGLGLLALLVYRRRSVGAAFRATSRNSQLLLVGVFVLLFIFFFSAIANFGIIARQRAQVFPFVFMWIAFLGRPDDTGRSA